jgi:hypothetical protein
VFKAVAISRKSGNHKRSYKEHVEKGDIPPEMGNKTDQETSVSDTSTDDSDMDPAESETSNNEVFVHDNCVNKKETQDPEMEEFEKTRISTGCKMRPWS